MHPLIHHLGSSRSNVHHHPTPIQLPYNPSESRQAKTRPVFSAPALHAFLHNSISNLTPPNETARPSFVGVGSLCGEGKGTASRAHTTDLLLWEPKKVEGRGRVGGWLNT